jgi:hypothetical protein
MSIKHEQFSIICWKIGGYNYSQPENSAFPETLIALLKPNISFALWRA